MSKFSNYFKLNYIRQKIENFAKDFFWVNILLDLVVSPIAFFVMIINDRTASFCWIPIVCAIAWSSITFVISMAMYVLAEFLENISTYRNKSADSFKRKEIKNIQDKKLHNTEEAKYSHSEINTQTK